LNAEDISRLNQETATKKLIQRLRDLQESVMRQTISGLVAAIALTIAGAAPAMACGYGGCYAPSYSHTYTGCGTCGWNYERLTDPETQYHSAEPTPQYYYADPGPTYTGPGAFAPRPHYGDSQRVATYRWRHHYSFHPRHGYRYGHAPHHATQYGYHYGRPALRRYY
jgi:hypothetical protein